MTTGNLYDALRESHERQRGLCRRLLRSKPGTRARIELFAALRLELAAHEAAEERYLYVPMLMDDAGLNITRHALADHHKAMKLVDELRGVDPATDQFGVLAKQLATEVRELLRH